MGSGLTILKPVLSKHRSSLHPHMLVKTALCRVEVIGQQHPDYSSQALLKWTKVENDHLCCHQCEVQKSGSVIYGCVLMTTVQVIHHSGKSPLMMNYINTFLSSTCCLLGDVFFRDVHNYFNMKTPSHIWHVSQENGCVIREWGC